MSQLNNRALATGLAVFGFLRGAQQTIIADLKAGRLRVNPDIQGEDQPDVDYRIIFKGWESGLERDVTDMSDDDFFEFLRSQPEGLQELR
jgi:hypothetical protein